jgi:hypothetical protein
MVARGDFAVDAPARPEGHPLLVRDESGAPFVHFAQPFPLVRAAATAEAYLDIGRYEAFTCLVPGSRPGKLEVERDAEARPVYAWKKDAPPAGVGELEELIKQGKLREEESLLAIRDVETGKPVRAHGGSVWKLPGSGRWALLFVEAGGSASFLGEVWYAEADHPLGPWAYARKVATHDRYSFYNPRIHDEFSDARHLYFEGTYVTTFSGNPVPTPRYDYNQVMYRLDLEDPQLALPVAIRSAGGPDEPPSVLGPTGAGTGTTRFLAPVRSIPGSVPVYAANSDGSGLTRTAPRAPANAAPEPLFHVLDPGRGPVPSAAVPLYEWADGAGRVAYAVDGHPGWPGYRRAAQPLGWVWPAVGSRAADLLPPLRPGLQ